MAKKTNKTSHVLNLITNGTPSDTANPLGPDPGSGQPVLQGQPASHEMSVLEAVAAEDHAAALRENAAALRESAAALREAVAPGEEDGDDEAGEEAPGPPRQPFGGREPSWEPGASREQDQPSGEASLPDGPAAAVTKEEPGEPQSRPAPTGDKKVIVVNKSGENDRISNEILNQLTSHMEEEELAKQEIYCMLNVMEQILEYTNLSKYMETYEVCRCSRCKADVKALILTRLPAKYVVVEENSVSPLIGYYESRYKVRIFTEIVKACMDVKGAPRHGSTEVIQSIKG